LPQLHASSSAQSMRLTVLHLARSARGARAGCAVVFPSSSFPPALVDGTAKAVKWNPQDPSQFEKDDRCVVLRKVCDSLYCILPDPPEELVPDALSSLLLAETLHPRCMKLSSASSPVFFLPARVSRRDGKGSQVEPARLARSARGARAGCAVVFVVGRDPPSGDATRDASDHEEDDEADQGPFLPRPADRGLR
jgi:hypothetical protein